MSIKNTIRIVWTVILILLIGSCSTLFGPDIRPALDHTEAGNHAAALKHYESIITEDKASAKIYRLAYESAFRSGKRVVAGNYYEAALEAGFETDSLSSLAIDLWYERALSVMGKNQWKSARTAAGAIARIAPGSDEDKFCVLILAGKKKYDRGSHKGLWDAVNDYSKATNYNTLSGLPYFLMGQARYKNDRNDYDAALEDYYQSLKIESTGTFSDQAKADIKKIEAVKSKMKAFWGK